MLSMDGRYRAVQVALLLALALTFLAPCSTHAQDRPLVFGTELDYPPFSFLDENGQPVGYNVDIARAIAQVMELDIEFRTGPWIDIRTALENGEIDAIVGMFYSPERDVAVDFSPKIVTIHHTTFLHDRSPVIETEEDLNNKSIIVMQSDIMHDYLLKNKITDRITTTLTHAETLQLLAQGHHDCALIAQLPGLFLLNEMELSGIRPEGPLFHQSHYCLAVKGGNTSLLDELNEGIATIASTGRDMEIYDRWLGVLHPRGVPREKVLWYLTLVFVPAVLLLALLFIHTTILKREVSRRTADLKIQTKDYQDLFDKMLNGFAVHEIICADDGKPIDYRFKDLNPAFEQLTGLSKDTTCGKTLREIIPDADPFWIEKYGQVALTGEPTYFEQYSAELNKTFEVFSFQPSPHHFACVINDISQQKESQRSLARYQASLQSLASRLANAEDLLRQEISADLHDSIGQDLLALKLTVDIMRLTNNSGDAPGLQEKESSLEGISGSLDEVVKKIRQLSFRISPPGLFESGLPSALEWLIHDFSSQSDIDFKLNLQDSGLDLNEQPKGLLFQVIRECLANAVKHGQPSEVSVTLTCDEGHCLAIIQDDGRGFDVEDAMTPSEPNHGFGLFSIRERLAFQSGKLEIESTPGEGSRVTVYLPLSEIVNKGPGENDTH